MQVTPKPPGFVAWGDVSVQCFLDHPELIAVQLPGFEKIIKGVVQDPAEYAASLMVQMELMVHFAVCQQPGDDLEAAIKSFQEKFSEYLVKTYEGIQQ